MARHARTTATAPSRLERVAGASARVNQRGRHGDRECIWQSPVVAVALLDDSATRCRIAFGAARLLSCVVAPFVKPLSPASPRSFVAERGRRRALATRCDSKSRTNLLRKPFPRCESALVGLERESVLPSRLNPNSARENRLSTHIQPQTGSVRPSRRPTAVKVRRPKPRQRLQPCPALFARLKRPTFPRFFA